MTLIGLLLALLLAGLLWQRSLLAPFRPAAPAPPEATESPAGLPFPGTPPAGSGTPLTGPIQRARQVGEAMEQQQRRLEDQLRELR
jgi:hypothetical protein